MTWVAVDSGNLAAVEYDAERLELTIEFNHERARYIYFRVPESRYRGLLDATSKNRYFLDHIKGRYIERRIR